MKKLFPLFVIVLCISMGIQIGRVGIKAVDYVVNHPARVCN